MRIKFLIRLREYIKNGILLILQRLWITFEYFLKNGLANHAAAGAYSLLLSAAPVLLILSFLISRLFINSPETIAELFQHSSFLSGVYNVKDLVINFLSSAKLGYIEIISGITILWTARLCALSIQRGIGAIFPSPGFNIVRSTVITIALGFIILLFISLMLLKSSFAHYFFNSVNIPGFKILYSTVLVLPSRILAPVCLTLMTLLSYRFVPPKPPKWKYIIRGTLVSMVLYQVFSFGFLLIVNPSRYNLLYGALGRLFLFMINVYFFFTFFFFGAQLVMIQNFSDVLLFIRFRLIHSRGTAPVMPWDKLFNSPARPVRKLIRNYREGDIVFARGSQGKEVYYILSGKAGVYMDDECRGRISLIEETHFFGEMEFINSEARSATIKAETDLSVLELPPELFRSIVQTDPATDQNIITDLTERIIAMNRNKDS